MAVSMNAAASGGMSMATAYQPRMTMPSGPTMQATTNLRMPTLGGPIAPEADSIRGDMTGDCCLTLDIDFQEALLCALWNEESSDCVMGSTKVTGRSILEEMKSDDTKNLESLVTNAIIECVKFASPKVPEVTTVAPKTKKKKNEVVISPTSGGITLVLPNSLSQRELKILTTAVLTTGYKVKNIFHRGLAVITGLLADSKCPLNASITVLPDSNIKEISDPVVLYISCTSQSKSGDNATSGYLMDASLVLCEGSARSKSNLGFERLNTLAVASIVVDGNDIRDDSLSDMLNELLLFSKKEMVRSIRLFYLCLQLVGGQEY